MCKGCVHVHVEEGVITKVILHLTDLPGEGIIHLTPDAIFSTDEFLETHPRDIGEIYIPACQEFFDLGDESIQAASR